MVGNVLYHRKGKVMTSEKEPNETETSNPVTRDIAREFNAIVDSVDEQSEFIRDRYFALLLQNQKEWLSS